MIFKFYLEIVPDDNEPAQDPPPTKDERWYGTTEMRARVRYHDPMLASITAFGMPARNLISRHGKPAAWAISLHGKPALRAIRLYGRQAASIYAKAESIPAAKRDLRAYLAKRKK